MIITIIKDAIEVYAQLNPITAMSKIHKTFLIECLEQYKCLLQSLLIKMISTIIDKIEAMKTIKSFPKVKK